RGRRAGRAASAGRTSSRKLRTRPPTAQPGDSMSTTAIPGSTRAAAQTLTAVGRVFFALGLIGLGISHSVFGDFMTGRAPAWPDGVPGGTAWAYGTGVVFIAIGAAILVRRGGRLAALFAAVLIFGWALLRNIPVVAA